MTKQKQKQKLDQQPYAVMTIQPMMHQELRSWPICWVCKRPILRLSSYTDLECKYIDFTAECHGKTQVTRLKYEDLCDTQPEELRFGYAFKPDNLLEARA